MHLVIDIASNKAFLTGVGEVRGLRKGPNKKDKSGSFCHIDYPKSGSEWGGPGCAALGGGKWNGTLGRALPPKHTIHGAFILLIQGLSAC